MDALAYQADEGRERLRYASGSCQLSVDPRMSEWGNPAVVMRGHPLVNEIVSVEGTRGSETS